MSEKAGPIGAHHDEKEWLEARRTGIGASEVAAILGQHPYLTERDVFFSKVLDETEKQMENKDPYLERGRVLEEPAANLYSRETGRQLRRMPLVRHKELPILFCSLDRQILAGQDFTGGEHPTAGLELKVPAWRNFAKVRKEGLPPHWILQAETQALVTGYPFIAFGILNADAWKMVTHDYIPVREIQERILERVSEWWERHVVAGVPPDPKIEEPMELPKVEADTTIFKREDTPWIDAVSLFQEARDILEAAQELDKTARDRLKLLMREAGQEVAEGAGLRAYLRSRPGRKSFQKKELALVGPVDPRKVKELLVHGVAKWSLSEAERLCEEAALDLDEFEREGNPFEEFRPYLLKGEV